MANYMKEVAKLLDVELGEKFFINHISPLTIFRFTVNGLQMSTGDDVWVTANYCRLCGLLDGSLSIRKCPWKPAMDDTYYYPTPNDKELWEHTIWVDSKYDSIKLSRGLVFKTIDEAVAAAKKMLAAVQEQAVE